MAHVGSGSVSLPLVNGTGEKEGVAATDGKPAESPSGPEGEETGGLRFKPMTGSPTQKPYERARSVEN